jgi:hypothetical protein
MPITPKAAWRRVVRPLQCVFRPPRPVPVELDLRKAELMRRNPFLGLLAAAAASLVACADVPSDELEGPGFEPAAEAEHDDEDDLSALEAGDGDFVEKAACGSRWSLPSGVTQDGNGMSVAYEGAGSRCQGGPTEGAEELGRYLRSNFPDLVDQTVSGRGIQIYACRNIRGGRGLSVHSTGRALDVFIPTGRGGAANNAKGDVIANWLVQNADRIGIQMLIWDRTIWKASGGIPRDRCYQGAHPHNDHIHVEISDDAADLNTPFFRGEAEPPMSGGDDSRADSPVAPGGNDAPINRDAWIGDLCRSDNDCGFSTDDGLGRCFLSHEPASGLGFCTVDCAGYCPDRAGKATTFCVGASLLGGTGGACVSKADSENAWCQSPSGFTAVSADRYIGRSGARAAEADVCLPTGR